MTLAARLHELRKSAGLQQQALADLVDARVRAAGGRGFDVTYLSKVENGRIAPPAATTLAILADELGADVDELCVLAGKAPADLVAALDRADLATLKAVRAALAARS